MEGNENKEVVNFPDINQKIAIQAMSWGVAGNHEQISIFPIEDSGLIDSSLMQTFYTSELYYKKKGTDTLSVFAASSSYTEDLLNVIGNVILEIHPINSNADVQVYSKLYKELALKRISVND